MRIIVLNGAKYTKKDLLAMELANNSDVVYIKPYTDKPIPVNEEIYEGDGLIHLSENQLSDKMEREIPLCVNYINGHRYVFFQNQLRADFVVMILDDAGLFNFKQNYKGDVVTVRVHSVDEEPSERVLMKDSEFDIVFNVDVDDYQDLENMVEYR